VLGQDQQVQPEMVADVGTRRAARALLRRLAWKDKANRVPCLGGRGSAGLHARSTERERAVERKSGLLARGRAWQRR